MRRDDRPARRGEAREAAGRVDERGPGLNEILATAGAPRGSLYHHFPRGKVEIGEEVVARAGAQTAATLLELAPQEEGVAAAGEAAIASWASVLDAAEEMAALFAAAAR